MNGILRSNEIITLTDKDEGKIFWGLIKFRELKSKTGLARLVYSTHQGKWETHYEFPKGDPFYIDFKYERDYKVGVLGGEYNHELEYYLHNFEIIKTKNGRLTSKF